MLTHFQIKSDNPAYVAGKATFSFVEKIKGKRRCAIIGGVPVCAEPSHASQNVMARFQVDSRQHKQGDDFPLSLIFGGAGGGNIIDNSGGTVANIIAALTNINALTAGGGTAQTTLPEIVRAQGVHVWAGGAAATDSISVVGLEDGDVLHVELVAVNGAEVLSKVVNDFANDQIDVTLSANGTDDVTTLVYTVFVGAAFDELDDLQKTIATELATQRTFNTAVLNSIATLAAQANRTQRAAQRGPYFPGRIIPLPDGSWCGGISVRGGSKIEIELEDLTTNAAPITEIILHGVEFPDSPRDVADWTEQDHAVERLWALLSGGVGEIVFYGNKQAQASGTALVSQVVEATPNMPNGKDFRRLETRYAVLDDTSFYVDEEEAEGVTLQLYTSTEGPAQGGPILARAICGDGGLSWPGAVAVDLECDQTSLVAITNGAPGADKTHYFASVFAGRHPDSGFLHASGAAA